MKYDDASWHYGDGAQLLVSVLDEKLTDQDFSDEGNAFATASYESLHDDSAFIDDYLDTFSEDTASIYSVVDTWANYDKLAARISEHHTQWETRGKPRHMKTPRTEQP